MIKVGIDNLAFYTPQYVLTLATLAKARGVEEEKFQQGLGQYAMSVPPPGEDIVTMGAHAAQKILLNTDLNDIELLLFATESGIDQSKSAGIYIHGLLGLPSRCRVVELKQACYGATAGLQLAMPFLRENPDKKVLLIASDVARYGLNSKGESSQGAAAVALLLSANPKILSFEHDYGVVTENVMDFWRPNYLDEAIVDGKYSSKLYLTMLEKCWQSYQSSSNRLYKDHDYFCYHTPVPRLVEKAHQFLKKINHQEDDHCDEGLQKSLMYNRKIGNSYTAALYICLISLLEQSGNLAGKRVGFYSYGSGCVAEFFSGVIEKSYKEYLNKSYHEALLAHRNVLDYEKYKEFYCYCYPNDGLDHTVPAYNTGAFRLTEMKGHKRIYQKVNEVVMPAIIKSTEFEKKKESNAITSFAPGKLILSGEHAVVYGGPALALAINCFSKTTITNDSESKIIFQLADLAYQNVFTLSTLRMLKDRIKHKYQKFINGQYRIRDVLHKPFELAQVAFGIFTEALQFKLTSGLKIDLQSEIPIGCGMGSSAATIVSVMQALSKFLNINMTKDELYKFALQAENMQHGRSSGFDLQLALQGGCLYKNGQHILKKTFPSNFLYYVNSGQPEVTTGQCIEFVAPYFKKNVHLIDDFKNVTNAMCEITEKNYNLQNVQTIIKENHQLLLSLNVVPEKIKHFVSEIEAHGGAAKISGAGAIRGDNAGAIIIATDNEPVLHQICNRFGYDFYSVISAKRGAYAA